MLLEMPGRLWHSGTFRLAVIGLTSAAVYWFGLVQLTPLLPHLTTPLLDLGKITRYRLEAAAQFAGAFAFLFSLYFVGYRYWPSKPSVTRAVIVSLGPIIFSALLLWVYPATAADVFDYMMHTRVLTHYGANPLTTSASFFPDDPFYPYAVWVEMPSVYGPLWMIISILPGILGGDDLLASILAFKVTAIFFYLLSALLIYIVLRVSRPQVALRGVFLFAWNPLVIWETAGNAHNDVAMVSFVLLALLLVARQKPGAALPSLAASTAVKYAGGLLGPLILMHGFRDGIRSRWPSLLAGCIGAVLVISLLYLPFWAGADTLDTLVRRSHLITASPAMLLSMAVEWLSGSAPPPATINAVATGVFLLFYLKLLFVGSEIQEDLPGASFRALFYYLVLASVWFQPWYIIWLVALASLSSNERYTGISTLFSATSIASYVVFIYLWVRYPQVFGIPQIQALAVAVIFALPVAVWVSGWRDSRRALTPRKRAAYNRAEERL